MLYILTYLTYCRVASQFTVCDASAAFSILAESSLHCFLSFASSVILTRSSVERSLKWSISPRSLFTTIGRVVVGRPLSLCWMHRISQLYEFRSFASWSFRISLWIDRTLKDPMFRDPFMTFLVCFDHFDRESYRLFGEPRAHRQQVSAMLSKNCSI